MKILIAGGQNEADFIIKMFKEEKHQLVVINSDLNYCKLLSRENHIKVYSGDPTQISVLTDAGIQDCDLVVSLCSKDEDNFVICQIASKVLHSHFVSPPLFCQQRRMLPQVQLYILQTL